MPQEWKEYPYYRFTRTRPVVLADLKKKLMEYDEILLKTKDMNALQRPSNRDYQSVVNWFDSRKPLVEEEATYIKRREDIVTLRSGRPGTEFDGFVERCLGGLDCFLPKRCNSKLVQKLFTTPELRAKSSDKHIHYYSPQRVDKLVSLLITTFIFVLLLVPVIAFYELSSLQRTSSPFDAVKV